MTYAIAMAVLTIIGLAVFALRGSFGTAPDESTGSPHEPRDDLR